MGIDFDMIDRYWEMNEDKIPERVICSACDGEGIIITKYYPATREDPADADYVDCEMCDGEGTYLDGDFEAENENLDFDNLYEWEKGIETNVAPTELIEKRMREAGFKIDKPTSEGGTYKPTIKQNGIEWELGVYSDEYDGYSRLTIGMKDSDYDDPMKDFDDRILHEKGLLKGDDFIEFSKQLL